MAGKSRPQKSRSPSPLRYLILALLAGVSVYLVFHSRKQTRSVDPAPATAEVVADSDPVIAEPVAAEPVVAEPVIAEPKIIKMATYTKEILEAGNGPTPKAQQHVTVSADLYLADASGGKGTAIWSTHKPSGFLFSANTGPQPFEYQAGVGGVVRGWEDGVMSMQLGESARLSIPWLHAYGASGHPGFKIPGKADLIFEITVLKIR